MTALGLEKEQMGSIGLRYSGRSNHFDFIRLTLAMLVIYSHSFVLASGNIISEPLFARLGAWHTIGSGAVSMFFFISGFLITQSWLRDPQFIPYWRKRALRILPAYALAAALCIFVLAPIVSGHWTPRALIVQALKIRTWESPTAFARNPFSGVINGAVWTIRYELWCYMIVALLGISGLLRKSVVVALLAVSGLIVAGQSRWNFLPDLRLGPLGELALWPRMLFAFAAGMAAYLYRHRIPYSGGLAAAAVAALVAAVWLRSSMGWAIGLPVLGGYAVLFIALARGLRLPPLSRVGDFSYGAYLYGFPIQQLLIRLLPRTGALALFFWASIASVAVAAISWYAIERPALSLKKTPKPSTPKPEPVAALVAGRIFQAEIH